MWLRLFLLLALVCLSLGISRTKRRHKNHKAKFQANQIHTNLNLYRSRFGSVSQLCASASLTAEQIMHCKIQNQKIKQNYMTKVWVGVFLTAGLIYYLSRMKHQCWWLGNFVKAHSASQFQGDSSKVLAQICSNRRRIIMTVNETPVSSNCFELICKPLSQHLYQLTIATKDQLGAFECEGCISFGDEIKICFTKQYSTKSSNVQGKYLIFEGQYRREEFQGEWHYEGCLSVTKMHGRWKSRIVQKGKYYV